MHRYQFVSLSGNLSNPYMMNSGIPQGSNLGPLLFIIFINDITQRIKYSECLLFADDLKIYSPVITLRDAQLLQADIDSVLSWCEDNRLYFNIQKCCCVTYSSSKNSNVVFQYKMGSEVLTRRDDVKDLGVNFSANMKFSYHIEKMCNNAMKMLGFVIRSTRDFKTINSIIYLYKTLVRSKLEYCIQVWDPGADFLSQRIETIQNKFIRYIYYKKYKTAINYNWIFRS